MSFAIKQWEMKYFCFCLFRADKINTFLLWLLIPLSLGAYYWIDFTTDSQIQWYIYFSSQQFYQLLLAYIVWNSYRSTPHSAISTAVLVKGIFSFISEILGINNKYVWFDVAWQVLMYALLMLAIKSYVKRAKRNTI